ncbi:unnamed protein product [Blepharisma stoltei]|uniref:Uncharacterized protein n=1 Tax=Blepharisma stoltei TaxID=1481888 RepID=A0AAU9IIE0_9CILI|nr:unnamed protein product [Blepharisma stoltei]
MNSAPEEDYDFLYKIVLVGDTSVGKTNIVSRYIKNSLPKNQNPTIGVEFATRVVTLRSGRTVKAQIWDTAGQERYHAIVSAHYRRAIGALLVYDITNARSFGNAQRWIEELKSKAEPDIVIMLVGNKIDLALENPAVRQVNTEQARKFAQAEGLMFIETSAVTSTMIKEAFETLLEEIYNNSVKKRKGSAADQYQKTEGQQLNLRMDNKPINKPCC